MWELVKTVIVAYLIMAFLLTCSLVIRMYWVNHKANAVKIGRKRIQELVEAGKWRQEPIYSMEAIKEKHSLGTVRLSYFENPTGRRDKYVIICPGGGYAHCVTEAEGFTIAAKVNELGYAAFVLEYRTGFNCSPYAPMEDLAMAILHIETNADRFHVDPKDYAICGFSAGGNLAGIYGSHTYGFERYGTERPGALLLGYPWTNVNHWMQHAYWNVWIVLVGFWLTERGNLYMFGAQPSRKKRDSLCVQHWITEDYPDTYMFAGSQDILVPASLHTDIMAEALEEHHVNYQYHKYFRVPHGIGIGMGTKAEGWLDEAIAFWQNAVAAKDESAKTEA